MNAKPVVPALTMRCLRCDEAVSMTEIGEVVTQRTTAETSLGPTEFVQRRYGTVNRPCGCIDGGLLFGDPA